MSFKDFNADTKKTIQSNLNQVIDVIQEDISGSATRRKYQTFVTGGLGPGVTSSLYQTIYDQDFTLQTANPVMDMTVGLYHYDDGSTQRPNLVTHGTGYSLSSTTGQLLFNATSTMMMREKVNIYRQFANYLLGDPDAAFILDPDAYPSSSGKTGFNVTTDTTVMDAALFVTVKRLFSRDGIRKETFAMRLYENAPTWSTTAYPTQEVNSSHNQYIYHYDTDGNLLTVTDQNDRFGATGTDYQVNVLGNSVSSSVFGVRIIADLGAAQSFKSENAGGDVGLLRLASDSSVIVGLIFYQAGIAVLNLGGSSILSNLTHATTVTGFELDTGLGQSTDTTNTIDTVFEPRDPMFGIIKGMSNTTDGNLVGEVNIGNYTENNFTQNTSGPSLSDRSTTSLELGPATFYPDLLVSASIDDIIDHIGYTRFSSGSLTATAFQNQTKINSSIYFCRASANEFNTSANPTFLDDSGVPVMVQDADNDKPFTYITTVALADSKGDVIAIAKLNRPIEKNDESEVTIRVRLDF